MSSKTASLRERRAERVKRAVLEAVIAKLDDTAADGVSMAAVASEAGVSLRTLYRYFPDRAALLHAAGEHLYESLGVPFAIEDAAGISASFLQAAARLAARPALVRALVQSTAGRSARSGVRAKRTAAIAAALRPLTERVDARLARRARAVIAHLCSAASWVGVAEESGLSDADAQAAVAWALDVLLAELRRPRAGPAPRPRSRRR